MNTFFGFKNVISIIATLLVIPSILIPNVTATIALLPLEPIVPMRPNSYPDSDLGQQYSLFQKEILHGWIFPVM